MRQIQLPDDSSTETPTVSVPVTHILVNLVQQGTAWVQPLSAGREQLTHILSTRKPAHNTLTAPGNVVHHWGHQSHSSALFTCCQIVKSTSRQALPTPKHQKCHKHNRKLAKSGKI